MKNELLARWLVLVLAMIAVAAPLAMGRMSTRSQLQQIDLHARMAEDGGWSLQTLQAQVGQPLRLRITSDDVVHGFAIGQSDRPSLEIDPGVYVDATLTFDRPGKYTFFCTRWCGSNHWRMRGIIEVAGEGATPPPEPQPLYLQLNIDIDHPPLAERTPTGGASPTRGARFASRLPAEVSDPAAVLTTSPAATWLRLRARQTLADLSDQDLWDVVAWIWQQQTPPEELASGQALYAANCAACHGEDGQGNGVMVRGLPVWEPDSSTMGETMLRPPDFTDPRILLGASPALLEGKIIRGGMGTGMPYWGPIFTREQIDALVGYLYSFAWKPLPEK